MSADEVVAHYKRGAQGQMVSDYHADYLAKYGPTDKTQPIPSMVTEDRRDNRDPIVVGQAHLLARLNGK